MSHRLPIFYGDEGPEFFFDWCSDMAYFFSLRNYDEMEQCNIAIQYLNGYALKWWDHHDLSRWERGLPHVITWEQLVCVLTRHFARGYDVVDYAAHICHYSRPRSEREPMPIYERECDPAIDRDDSQEEDRREKLNEIK